MSSIITVPHPKLKAVSLPVTKLDKKLLALINDLETTLKHKKNPQGVGLSAPQIAKNLRLFSTYLDWGQGQEINTYINPRIIKSSPKLTLGGKPDSPLLEGCLSIPKIYGPVWRHSWIKLEWQYLNLQTQSLTWQSKKFDSFPARVVQHEIDHLDGILFTQRALSQNLQLFREQKGDLVPLDA